MLLISSPYFSTKVFEITRSTVRLAHLDMSTARKSRQEMGDFAVEANVLIAVKAGFLGVGVTGYRFEFWETIGEIVLGIDGFADCSAGLGEIYDIFVV
jgi:hypothetical protein